MTQTASEPRSDQQELSWFRWSVARFMATSRLPQVSAFIPAIGYTLLWSDQFSEWLDTKELGSSLIGLTTHSKLQLLWWGAVFMTIGWLTYLLRCPKTIRRCAESEDYVLERLQLRDLAHLALTRTNVEKLVKDYHPHDQRPLLYVGLSPHEVIRACESMFSPTSKVFDVAANSLKTIYTLEFYMVDHERARERIAAVSLLALGAFLFLIPSADVTLRVLRRLLFS